MYSNIGKIDFPFSVFSEIKGRQPWPTMNSLISLDLDFNMLGDNLGDGRWECSNVSVFFFNDQSKAHKLFWNSVETLVIGLMV